MAQKEIEILLDVLNQACQKTITGKGVYIWGHRCLSAYETAFFYLEEQGYIKEIKRGRYRGYWKVLNWF